MAKMTHDYLETTGLKPAATEISKAQIAINLVDKTLWTKDANGVVISVGGSGSSATLAPTLSGVTTANENTDVAVTIDNYSSTLTYVVTVSGGTFVRSGATITWTLPEVTVDTLNTISVTAENVGISTVSSATVHSVNVLNIPTIADQALVYDSTSMTEFTSLANTTATTTLDAVAIDTTNIISGHTPNTTSTVDILGDGSCIALYELEGNANDTSGVYNGTATGVTYGVGKFGQAGVFDGSTSNIQTTFDSNTLSAVTYSFWMASTSTSNYSIMGFTGTSDMYIQCLNGTTARVFFRSNLLYTDVLNFFVNDGTFHHYTFTIDSVGLKHYRDSILIGTSGQVISSVTLPFQIGTDGTSYVLGSIDQVRIFNKALTASEVTMVLIWLLVVLVVEVW